MHIVRFVGIGSKVTEGLHKRLRQYPDGTQRPAIGQHRKDAGHGARRGKATSTGDAAFAHILATEDFFAGANLQGNGTEWRCIRRQLTRRRINQSGDTRMLSGWNTHPEIVDPERLDNFFLHESPERSAFRIGAAYDLRNHPAKGQTLVAIARARLEHRRQSGD